MKRPIVGVLIVAVLFLGPALWTGGGRVLNLVLGPDDDPHFFCTAPDPSPFPTISSSTVLQGCSAGKTVTIRHGDTLAVDLPSDMCIDQCSRWDDFAVSDESVLRSMGPPEVKWSRSPEVGGVFFVRQDLIADYRAVKAGESTISAVSTWCSANTGRCARAHRWKADVRVT